MVVSCIVPSCTEKSRKGKNVSFHAFPLKDNDRCKQWLRAVKHPNIGEDAGIELLKHRKVCSLHFKPEDFMGNIVGLKWSRPTLRETAVPSVFALGPLQDQEEAAGPSSAPPAAKRYRLQNPVASAAGILGSGGQLQGQSSQGTLSSIVDTGIGHGALTITASSIPRKTDTLPLTSTPVKSQGQSTSCPDTPGTLDTSFSTVGEEDESYKPDTTVTPTSTSSSSSEDESTKDWKEKKIIVNESCLMSLFKFCQMCGQPVSSKSHSDSGAQRKVMWTCLGGHSGTWSSSPEIRGMAEVNLLSAAAVLFKGGTYTELSDWCKTMQVQMISETTFYEMQKTYLHPAIEDLYQEQRKKILARVYLQQEDGKTLHLAGDGRCDTPGFSAKYCHYTFMIDDTKEIIHTELLQSTEAGSSVAMEPLGFKRGMNEILGDGLDIEVLTTDRSTSIRKIMREQFPEVKHEFDIWHTAKSVRKKIQSKGRKKGNKTLAAWSRSIVNHMWFSCASSKGDTEKLKSSWQSILHHVRNEHEWEDDDGTHRCQHAPLTAPEMRTRRWMKKDSLAFEDLSSLVHDKRLMKDLEQMALFKHTGPLEVFHSALLKYLPKRQGFSFQGMRQRGHLAILEHNENIVKRKQATTEAGVKRVNQVYCKRSKQWVVKKIFNPHTYEFIDTLLLSVIDRRRNKNIRYKSTSSLALPQPALPPNIAPVAKPPKDAAVAAFESRF